MNPIDLLDDAPTAAATPSGRGQRTDVPPRRRFLQTAVAAGLMLDGWAAHAQTVSGVIFGFVLTPSTEDLIVTIVRDLHAHYRPDLGVRPVYLPGNSGALAMASVANGPSDGTSVLLTAGGAMTLLPMLNKLPIDPAAALQPVAGVGQFVYAFVVGPAVPEEVRTMADYLRWAQLNPGKATYGLPGRGTAPHFVGVEIARLSEVGLKSVGYKGLLPIMQDLAKGAMPAAVTVRPSGSDAINFPTVRTLAVSSGRRWPGSADVPTLLELGLAESPTVDSLGFFVASGTPAGKVAELREAVGRVLLSPATVAALGVVGLEPMPADIDYAVQIARDRVEWQARVDRHRFTAES